jgi:hypothetical protein
MNAIDLEKAQHIFINDLPDMLRISLWAFKGRDPERREDLAWTAVELCWRYWIELYEQGRGELLRPCLSYCIRQARAGRDVSQARRVPPIEVVPWEGVEFDVLFGRLAPDAEVALRLDVTAWMDSLRPIDAALAAQLGNGERVTDVARALNVTPGRVSQRRDALTKSWLAFTADPDTAA